MPDGSQELQRIVQRLLIVRFFVVFLLQVV